MAKIVKLKKRVDLETVHTVYPITIPEGVIDPVSKKSVKTILVEKADHGYGEEETAKTLKEVESQKADHGYGEEETPKSLKEIDAQKADHGYGDEEPVKTLKEIDTNLVQLATNLSVSQAEQDASIKQIEQILSQSNLNHTAQVSSTGREIVSLPRTASNGGMQVKLEGLTAENLVVNGDFRNGLTGWVSSHSSSTNTLIGGNLVNTGNGASTKAYAYTRVPREANIVYYTVARVRAISSDCLALSINEHGATGPTSMTIYNPVQNQWYNLKIRYTTTELFNFNILISHSYNDALTQSGKGMEVDYLATFNLTATFGAGNEPDLATCDKMFSSYFEGRKNFVPTGRVRSVGKNLWVEPREKKLFDSYSLTASIVDLGESVKITGPGSLVKKIYIPKGTYKLVIDGYTDSGSLGIFGIYYIGGVGIGVITADYTRGVKTSAAITVPESGWYDVRYYPSNSSSTGHNMYVYSAMLIRADASASYEPYKETNLYLTAPELRSNGTVKDEIRKGANGYELVKRVGVATLGSELITNAADREFSSDTGFWVRSPQVTIANGVANILSTDGSNQSLAKPSLLVVGKFYKLKLDVVRVTTGSLSCDTLGATNRVIASSAGSYSMYDKAISSQLTFKRTSYTDTDIDNISIKEIIPQDGAISDTSTFTELSDGTVLYTLKTPIITPISYGGILNSAENGTVYHEPVIADAGVYSTKMDIFNIDYPISALEEIRVHSGGVDTYLDVSAAVIAADGKSFTHPSLSDGDTVLFTYFFNKERVNGLLTATYYDGRYVIADSANGKFYKWGVKSTNGVPAINLTEV